MNSATTAKEPCYLRSQRSPVFARYCERVYGRMLNQYGAADMEQLALLVRVLRLPRHSLVLDAGCGTGETTRYLAEQTGARFLGIDTSEPCIAHAGQLAKRCPNLLDFQFGSIDDLPFSPGSFDAIISIDSVYFCKDMNATMEQFKRVLRPSGQIALLYTHVTTSPEQSLKPNDSKVALALCKIGVQFDAYDLSDSDRRFWLRAKEAGEELRAEFEAEGNGDLTRLSEASGVLDTVRKGCHARYLYHAPLP